MKKWVLLVLIVLCLLINKISVSAMEVPATDSTDTLNIIHINDVHGYAVETDSAIGYAKIAGFVEVYKSANPDNTLFIDAGDVFQGNVYATFDKNESLLEILNTLDLDVMTAGNSEYGLGVEKLKENAAALNYPILGANMVQKGTDTLAEGTKAYEIITTNSGKKVGIIGITTEASSIGNENDLDYLDPNDTAQKYVNELSGQVDVLIGLVHLGINESEGEPVKKLAEAVPEFDLLIDGHSHHIVNEVVNWVPIVQAGSNSSGLGVTTISFDEDGSISAVEDTYYGVENFVDQTVKADTQMATNALLEKYDENMNVVVGSASVFLEAAREVIRTRETNMGNVYTDAVRLYTGADIALIHSGVIGGDVGPGDITLGDIMTMDRLSGTITTKAVTGSQLIEALNNSVSKYPEVSPGLMQVSGLNFTFNPDLEGDRVISVKVSSEDIDPDQTYTVAVFTSVKDNYAGIKDGTELQSGSEETWEILLWYFQKYSPISTEVEGRMVAVSGEEENPGDEQEEEETPSTQEEDQTESDSKTPTASSGQTQKTAAVTDNPSTGDNSQAAVYIVLVMVALIAIIALVVVRRKFSGNKK